MIRTVSAVFVLLTTSAVMAEEARQLDAHEHGVGQLDIAFEQGKIAMVLHAPGADIVGFEYAAQSSEDRAKVDAAVATLARPLDLFSLPASAGCSVVEASASLESEAAQDDHDQAAHKDEGHAHDHAEADHKEEDQSHAKEHGHEDHAEQAGHTEFHAEYLLECADPTQATLIAFGYFEAFANARELEVQVISERGASAFEVERDAPTLDLRSLF
ncbi:DUF2796 domain-containing protein [uncultured Sulfitobacter sp.]|uniref:zinc uptake protein ZrgA n=1 Tax=uncultured Sulfitobacter sp. TaxID=191468 RepID=UPI00262C67E9|nr:DUF2796 domain-containing protein [uncultured Sulfitobacter sp.]